MRGGECMDASGNPQLPTEDYSDPIQLSNLLDLDPEQRITINKTCYNIDDIYQWIITQNNNLDPMRKEVIAEDRTRIRNTYNALHPEANQQRAQILADVTQNGMDLYFASYEEINDREIVLAAVTQNGRVLQFASVELQNDREIVLAAVRTAGDALRFASPELQNDPEVIAVAFNI